MHKEQLKKIYRNKKSAQWLMGEHNRLFADWFEEKVSFLISYINQLRFIYHISAKLSDK